MLKLSTTASLHNTSSICCRILISRCKGSDTIWSQNIAIHSNPICCKPFCVINSSFNLCLVSWLFFSSIYFRNASNNIKSSSLLFIEGIFLVHLSLSPMLLVIWERSFLWTRAKGEWYVALQVGPLYAKHDHAVPATE